MVSVRINGEDAPVKTDGCSRISDLVELIKSVMDPDHMISQILIDGKELEESDWSASPSKFETSIIEIETGTPEQFVGERLLKSGNIVQQCYLEFRGARQQFQDGKSVEANKRLVQAVQALQAFFEWYGSLMDLLPEEERKNFDISEHVIELSETCKGICQHQLYQSWWALGEALQSKLEPQLDQLEAKCHQFREHINVAPAEGPAA